MPKYLVTRTRYFEQTDTVMVEAPDAPSAQTEAKTTDSPIDHEYLTHAPELYVTTRVHEVDDVQAKPDSLRVRQRLAENLNYYRMLRGKTYRDLCDLTGLSLGKVQRACSGGRGVRLETAEALASALGVSLATLFSEPEPLEMAA